MGVSPWKSIEELYHEKILGLEMPSNPKMERGIELEEPARQLYTEMTGIQVKDKVVFHPFYNWMMASLDGMSVDNKRIMEIKVAGKVDHALAKKGKIPEKYYPQLQHQMEVCRELFGIDEMDYFSFNGKEGVIVNVKRDHVYIQGMIEKELEFWNCLKRGIAPKETYTREPSEFWTIEDEKKWIESF